MTGSETVEVRTLLEDLPLRGVLLRVPVICVMLMFVEGIDAFGIGFIGPFLAKELALSTDDLGTIFTGTVVASLIGATLLAPLSDRFGRRTLLLWTSSVMVPTTLLTAHAPNFATLFALRFVIGAAFGAALPTAIALVADYAPTNRKSLLLMLLNAGIGAGVVVAGYCAAVMIPVLGWQSLLYASALVSVIAAFFAWVWIPESLQHLLRTGREGEAIALLGKIANRPLPARLVCEEAEHLDKANPVALFRANILMTTVLLWTLSSMSYVIVNFTSYWLPTVMLNAGADITLAGVTISTGKLCGIAGIFAVGWLADHFGLSKIVTANFLLTGVLVLLIASNPPPAVAVALLLAAMTFNGANVSGGQALIATSYPSQLRATAFGWISGFARLIGGGFGTLVGGWIIAAGWTFDRIALLMGSTLLINAVVVQLLFRSQGNTPQAEEERAHPPVQPCKS
ncbi:hypothetical protein MB02_07525 [Croceicoccus estronivorus]|uniref:MFS transporter n=1 Tax=Croceicoccus estronivorus TaxID=1172626 RepID=UPI00082CCF07|nr:MFS transporter [Croceicoccus estronivorus]OCC24420.1 hypothetical protein MB02_07525 [Croceicoccus estronivorus]